MKSRQAAPNTERGVVTQYEWGEAAHSEFGEGVLEGVVTQVSTRVVVVVVGGGETLSGCGLGVWGFVDSDCRPPGSNRGLL